MNKKAIENVKVYLRYMGEDTDGALDSAKDIKDPELTKKLEEIKSKTEGVKDYIVSKTDAKTAG